MNLIDIFPNHLGPWLISAAIIAGVVLGIYLFKRFEA